MEPYFALAIALLRAREAGDNVTDEEVLSECQDWDVDPGPVMILVQGKAPARRWGYYDLGGGKRKMAPYPGDVYFHLGDHVFTDTPEMTEAMGLRIASRR